MEQKPGMPAASPAIMANGYSCTSPEGTELWPGRGTQTNNQGLNQMYLYQAQIPLSEVNAELCQWLDLGQVI